MRTRNVLIAAAALAVLTLALGQPARASGPVPTIITVSDMHCAGCAKKMAAKLYQIPGVATVQADVPSTRLIIVAAPQQAPSPKALWEAVENAGYTPAKLEGPGGTFTAKPPA